MSHWMSTESQDGHRSRYQVLAFLCVCALIAYVQRAALSVPAAEIAKDLRFSDLAREMGWIQSGWYLCYALMQLPSGWLADRIGSRRGLAILSVVWSLATLLCAFATDFLSLLLLWSVMGAAQAGVFPCAVKALGQIFPETERARATGLLGSGMTIGGALAPVLAAVFLASLSPWANSLSIDRWRLLLAAYALPGILWMVAFLTLISVRKLPATERTSDVRTRVQWSRMLSSVSLALLCATVLPRGGHGFLLDVVPDILAEDARCVGAELGSFDHGRRRWRRFGQFDGRLLLGLAAQANGQPPIEPSGDCRGRHGELFAVDRQFVFRARRERQHRVDFAGRVLRGLRGDRWLYNGHPSWRRAAWPRFSAR